MTDRVIIRAEISSDPAGIRHVHEIAFGRPNEADLVDALRRHGQMIVSFVASRGDRVIGHIAFSPVEMECPTAGTLAVGLGPVAVLPEWQHCGIGSSLIRKGLEACRNLGQSCVFVLGDPAYYTPFGFVPAATYGFRSEYPDSEESFMVIELIEDCLAECAEGIVRYGPEFKGV